jgi:hypothetical protein
MLHRSPASLSPEMVTPIGSLLHAETLGGPGPAAAARSDHARMLAHAAKRRLAASGPDGDYWKACAPAAVARAAAIRSRGGFVPLP